MTRVTRTINTTHVNFVFVDVDGGKPVIHEHAKAFPGLISAEKAQRLISKEVGKPCTVTGVEVTGELYGMPLETFMQYAEKIEKDAKTEEGDENG